MLKRIFWGSAALVAYYFIGFPVSVVARGLLFARPFRRGPAQPRVSLIITAHNEQSLIEQKLANCLQLDYPSAKLEILVASDGSSDRTDELVTQFAPDGIRLIQLPRNGKNAAMSAAAALATGDILVFNDADTAVTRTAIQALVAPFADPEVGAVAGERRHRARSAGLVGRLQRRARRRSQELLSQGGSICIAGLLYAIRREDFRPVPPNVVDDLFIPMQAVMHHRRFVFEPRAATYPLGPRRIVRAPFARMVRMNVQHLRSYGPLRRLFNPLEYGFFSLQLFSQKLLGRFLVIPLAGLLGSGVALWHDGRSYRFLTSLQFGFHALALLGWALQLLGVRRAFGLRSCTGFDRDLLAGAASLYEVLLGRDSDKWESHSRTTPSDSAQRAPKQRSVLRGSRPRAIAGPV